MIIDVFKDRKVFDNLEQYNGIVKWGCRNVTFAPEGEQYDLKKNKVSYWYNPGMIWDLHISHHYPHKTHGLTKDPKFNLFIYFPNYISMYLIDLFYAERKTVLIEDMAGGDGRFALYLSKLGFTNFHITENFSQLSEYLLREMMKVGRVSYQLNVKNTQPVIVNLVGWTELTRPDWPSSVELACFYNNSRLTKREGDKCWILSPSGSYIEMPGFKYLCFDIDQLMHVFCHESKYDEFVQKIQSRGIVL